MSQRPSLDRVTLALMLVLVQIAPWVGNTLAVLCLLLVVFLPWLPVRRLFGRRQKSPPP
jgi:hypothetical protein